METDNKTYYEEIDIVKGFAIFLAVLGHSFPDAEKGWYIIGQDSFAHFVMEWIYSFHMPVFFMFAGFLFIPRTGRFDIKTNLLKRFKRLMVPYLFFSLIYILGKTIGSSVANHPLSPNYFVDMLFGKSPAGGCWFLWVLFVMSVVCVLAKKLGTYWLFVMSILMYILYYIDKSWMIGKIDLVFYDFIWFALGGVLAKHYVPTKKILDRAYIGILAFLLLTCLQFCNCFWLTNVLGVLSGIIMLYCFSTRIAEQKKGLFRSVMKGLGKYCMDIYIISMLVVIPLRILYTYFHLYVYIPYYVWVGVVTFLGCVIPILVSKHFVRKRKWLNLLVLGG